MARGAARLLALGVEGAADRARSDPDPEARGVARGVGLLEASARGASRDEGVRPSAAVGALAARERSEGLASRAVAPALGARSTAVPRGARAEAAAAPSRLRIRSEGRATSSGLRVEGARRPSTLAAPEGRLGAAASVPARLGADVAATAGDAGAADPLGLRTAVRTDVARGFSLNSGPVRIRGEGRVTTTPLRPPEAYTVRTRPP